MRSTRAAASLGLRATEHAAIGGRIGVQLCALTTTSTTATRKQFVGDAPCTLTRAICLRHGCGARVGVAQLHAGTAARAGAGAVRDAASFAEVAAQGSVSANNLMGSVWGGKLPTVLSRRVLQLVRFDSHRCVLAFQNQLVSVIVSYMCCTVI